MDPAWSPSGDQYAFVTDRRGPMEIWIHSRDSQWQRPLVTAAEFPSSSTETLGSLAFSPNGRQLAFQQRGTDRAATTIWLIPATGGTPVRLIPEDLNSNSDYHDGPSWSPDGEWVSFTQSNGLEFSLAKIRVGSHERVDLIEQVVPFTRPAWSPDGEWIAIQTPEGLVRIPANGGQPQVLLEEPTHAYAWADAKRLFALVESETIGHLAFVEIDATTREVRTLNPDLGTIPVAVQPVRGLSFVKGLGFLTSLASARSDIWLLEGFELPRQGLMGWSRR
jgi:WD40 repeat protein